MQAQAIAHTPLHDDDSRLIGLRHGTRTIIGVAVKHKWESQSIYLVECDCGDRSLLIKSNFFKTRRCKTCCRRLRLATLAPGTRSGRREIVRVVGAKSRSGATLYEVKCDCGRRSRITRSVFLGSHSCRKCVLLHNPSLRYVRAAGSEWTLVPYEDHLAAKRFVEDHPGGAVLEEIASAMGLTRERVRQIEFKAKRKLKRIMAEMGSDGVRE